MNKQMKIRAAKRRQSDIKYWSEKDVEQGMNTGFFIGTVYTVALLIALLIISFFI